MKIFWGCTCSKLYQLSAGWKNILGWKFDPLQIILMVVGYFLNVNFVHLSYFRLCGVSPLFLPYCLFSTAAKQSGSFLKDRKIQWKSIVFSKEGFLGSVRILSVLATYCAMHDLSVWEIRHARRFPFDQCFLSFWKIFSRFRSRFHNIVFLKENFSVFGINSNSDFRGYFSLERTLISSVVTGT